MSTSFQVILHLKMLMPDSQRYPTKSAYQQNEEVITVSLSVVDIPVFYLKLISLFCYLKLISLFSIWSWYPCFLSEVDIPVFYLKLISLFSIWSWYLRFLTEVDISVFYLKLISLFYIWSWYPCFLSEVDIPVFYLKLISLFSIWMCFLYQSDLQI